MTARIAFGTGLMLGLATQSHPAGDGVSATYLLRNARLDGTRMSVPADPHPELFRTYTLKGIHLGSPIQGSAAGADFSLHLLAGAWIWRPGDPPPDMGCLYTPQFCGGPGTWDRPPSGSTPVPAPPAPAGRAASRRLEISGKLYNAAGGEPVGGDGPVMADLRFSLFRTSSGGTAVYSEEHTSPGGNPVRVDEGRFSLHLGADPAGQDIGAILSAHDDLFAQFQVGDDVLQPRIPVTGGLLSGVPTVLGGAADPTAFEPPGTYYRNSSDGSTWIRMTSSWVRIAP
jgi:hypothetical protein